MLLPWMAAAWLAGLAAAGLSFEVWQWSLLAATAAAGAFFTRQERLFAAGFLVAMFLFLGAARAEIAIRHHASSPLATMARTAAEVEIQGVAASVPSPWGESFEFVLRPEWTTAPGSGAGLPAGGNVLVRAETSPAIRRGDTVLTRGRLRPPDVTDQTRYAAVLEAESVHRLASPGRWNAMALLDRWRDLILVRLRLVLPESEAALAAGVLLGADEQMPEADRLAFRTTGTAHILAVSGFNVAVVAAAAAATFGRLLGARRGAIAAGVSIAVYTLLCGAEPPVVRAALMGGVALVGARLGRQSTALSSLGAAVILMTLWDPGVLYDVGFQLSVLATLGLVLTARPIHDALRQRPGGPAALALAAEVVLLTLVAQAATLPLSAYVFGRMPLASLPANALILPAQPLLMATGALTSVAALVDLQLGRLVAWLVWPFAAYTLRVVEAFAALPGASLDLERVSPVVPWIAYGAMASVAASARIPRVRSAARAAVRAGGPGWLVVLAALTAIAWRAAVERPDGRLHLTALPGGDVLIESPTGRFIAISPGPGQRGLAQSLEGRLPLTRPELDWLILTHPDGGVGEAADALGRHAPGRFLLVGDAGGEEAAEADAEVVVVRGADEAAFDLGRGARLAVIDARAPGPTLLLTFGSAGILMSESGDAAEVERLVRAHPVVAVVLLGDGRGAASAMDASWPWAAPRLVILDPLPGDRPPEIDDEPASPLFAAVWRRGWIRLSTDGKTLEVTSERGP